jgi:DNA-binding transcriptional LysR family regulator
MWTKLSLIDSFCIVMDTQFLDSFVTVVDFGSMAEAARRLNLTPAAVAQRIRALEDEIGATLFVRSGRTVKPTAAGMAILGRSRNFLKDLRDLKSIAVSDAPSGQLHLGAFQSALAGVLPDILASMATKYPQIEVRLVRADTRELYSHILSGDLDVVITLQPSFAIPKAYNWRGLWEEPLIVLTPASKQRRDPHAILASEPFIRLGRTSWTGRIVERYLRQAGIRPHERFELDSLEAIAGMVDRGLGVSLVPDWTAPWPEGLSLRKVQLPGRPVVRRIGAVWAVASVRVQLVHALIEEATAVLKVIKPRHRAK